MYLFFMHANHCSCYIAVCMCVGMGACNRTHLMTQPEIVSETLVIFDITYMRSYKWAIPCTVQKNTKFSK